MNLKKIYFNADPPHERAAYLTKELGITKALAHVKWILVDVNPLTKEYWEEVLGILNKKYGKLFF